MLRNPETYKDPEVFNPERFLGENPETDPRRIIFGLGRRICPGRHLADSMLFLACASVLSTFNLLQKQDEQGKKIVPDVKYSGIIITYVEPGRCVS
jgi:cytochrome P450